MNKRKSVRFVDIAFMGLLLTWLVPVWYQKVNTEPTPDMKPVLAQVVHAASRVNRRFSFAEVCYKFTGPDGKEYGRSMYSFSVWFPTSRALSDLQGKNTLLVYYLPEDPRTNTSPEVGNIFAEIEAWNYLVTGFLIGLIKLILDGMSAMSGERRRPGKEIHGVW